MWCPVIAYLQGPSFKGKAESPPEKKRNPMDIALLIIVIFGLIGTLFPAIPAAPSSLPEHCSTR